jgi:hypothetical protein
MVVYNKFAPAEKAKLWQLKKPGKTPGSGPAGKETNKSAATVAKFTSALSTCASQISKLTATTDKQTVPEEGGTNKDDSKTNENCSNSM